jgi:glycosyltransferase involved in cell wall biosynthesis
MKVIVAVMTFNRLHLLKRTLASMDADPGHPFERIVVDGGSADIEQRWFVAQQQRFYQFPVPVTVGASMNYGINAALDAGADLIVCTADDYDFVPGWLARLAAYWQVAPPEVAIASLNWEPMYPWNTITERQNVGGERVLIRATVPGSSWSFRRDDWPAIGPVADQTGGEDLAVCHKMHEHGRLLAALNLTAHTGERESAWGNQSWQWAKPLEADH